MHAGTQSGDCPFDHHEGLITFYWDKLERDPPANYVKVTIEQVRVADFEVMKEVQRYTRATGLRKTPTGVYPVAEALKEAIKLPTVYQLLAHLPRHAVAASGQQSALRDRSRSPPSTPSGAPKRQTWREKKAAKSKAKPAVRLTPRESPRRPGVPEQLRSDVHPEVLREHPTKGGRFCFGFNLRDGCRKATAGEKCDRGWHLCPKRGCHRPHCYSTAHPEG